MNTSSLRPLDLPSVVEKALAQGAALAVSLSGGKDSHAMLDRLVVEKEIRRWPGPILAVNAHLGRMDWPETAPMCQRLCAQAGIQRLDVVQRSRGDLVQAIGERREKTNGGVFWPSPKSRYCNSDSKRGPIEKVLRQYSLVISAEGIRAEESSARSKRPVCSMRSRITSTALRGLSIEEALEARKENQRLAIDWFPLHTHTVHDVWASMGTSQDELDERRQQYQAGQTEKALAGWIGHPAYVYGNERMGCVFCFMGSQNDMLVGARHNPALLHLLAEWERESGYSYQSDRWLKDIEEAQQVAQSLFERNHDCVPVGVYDCDDVVLE